MLLLTVTDFSRNLKATLDLVEFKGEEIVLIRNKHKIARITPGSPHLTALEAMSDLYRTLPEDAAANWEKESRLQHSLEEVAAFSNVMEQRANHALYCKSKQRKSGAYPAVSRNQRISV